MCIFFTWAVYEAFFKYLYFQPIQRVQKDNISSYGSRRKLEKCTSRTEVFFKVFVYIVRLRNQPIVILFYFLNLLNLREKRVNDELQQE